MLATYTPHRFNPNIATGYGINAALIFQYIGFRAGWKQDTFVRLTLDEVHSNYPYMGRWEVRAALAKLMRPGRRTPSIVNRQLDEGGYRYAVKCRDLDRISLHVFDSALAGKIGVIPAIVYHNLSFWIKENWQRASQEVFDVMQPGDCGGDCLKMNVFAYVETRSKARFVQTVRAWVVKHPYVGLRSVERATALLVKRGMLEVSRQKSRFTVWKLPSKSEADWMRKQVETSGLLNATAKITLSPPKSHSHRQNHTLTAKITQEQHLNSEVSDAYTRLVEAYCRSAIVETASENTTRSERTAQLAALAVPSVGTTLKAASPTLARRESKRMLETVSAETVSRVAAVTRPVEPKAKSRIVRDIFGDTAKSRRRRYRKIPTPDDDDYELYLETLPRAEIIAARRQEAVYYAAKEGGGI